MLGPWSSILLKVFMYSHVTILVTHISQYRNIFLYNTVNKAHYGVIKLHLKNCVPKTLQSKTCLASQGLSQVLPCQTR